ncbi:MAG: alanine racemase C-terminal domain-containing protein [Schumannella sp.]|nr:alanine racemase [Microbacteriaceae bacterium]
MAGIRRVARIDLEALASNLAGASASFLDARADAYGHNLALVGPVARDAGIVRVLVSDDRDAALASAAGLTPVVGRLAPPDVGDLAGAAAYGLESGGRPVMTLVGEVIAVKHVGAGAGVSYGYTYRTPAPTHLALVGLGYADGVPRIAGGRAHVAIDGRALPLVGRIAMDQFVVDCGDDPVGLGDEVALFGSGSVVPSAGEWAGWTTRDALAVTAGLGPRIHREARA